MREVVVCVTVVVMELGWHNEFEIPFGLKWWDLVLRMWRVELKAKSNQR